MILYFLLSSRVSKAEPEYIQQMVIFTFSALVKF